MQGRFFKHYEVLQLLGRGGMGEVYLATDTTLERKVALKFLPRSLMNDPAAQGRLFDEARSCSRIQHPNIAVVYAIEEDGGVYALCMEYVEGRTLRDILADHELSLNRVARIGRAIAAGMTAAHEQGVIHRDLKPANVMLTRRGEVKIMDFGLALRPKRIVTTAGPNSFGTVSYMSPEQARGETPTALSDIFSFGTTLYELLTRRPPFDGENDLAVLQAIISEDSPPLRELRRNVPPAIERVVRRCMAKDPGDRFPSMAAVAAELQYVEPVVEAGPKDLIHELANELTAPEVAPPSKRAKPSGPTPRKAIEPTAEDGLPPIAPVLTVPLAETLVEEAFREARPSPSRSRRTRRSGVRQRETRVNDLWRDASRPVQTVNPRQDTRYRTQSLRTRASVAVPRPERTTGITYDPTRRKTHRGRIVVLVLKLILGLLLAGLGAQALLRAAGVEIHFRPVIGTADVPADGARGSSVTGLDLRRSVDNVLSKVHPHRENPTVSEETPPPREDASARENASAPRIPPAEPSAPRERSDDPQDSPAPAGEPGAR